MSNPQQPEQRHSGGNTPQGSAQLKASRPGAPCGSDRAHGTDKGEKGSGEGGGTPPEQQSGHL
jgi:hypothetical protein